MSDTTDLIARLRKPDSLLDDPDLNDEAADAIEALARENEALRAEHFALAAGQCVNATAAEDHGRQGPWRWSWTQSTTANISCAATKKRATGRRRAAAIDDAMSRKAVQG